MKAQRLAIVSLLSLSAVSAQDSADGFYNQNYLPYFGELTTCTDPSYHTDCAWNECCGYLEACCDKDAAGDYCDYNGKTVASDGVNTIVNMWPECRDPYDLDTNVPGRIGKYYLYNVEPNAIAGVTQDYTNQAAWGPREFGVNTANTDSTIVGPIADGSYPVYKCLDTNLNKVRDLDVTT